MKLKIVFPIISTLIFSIIGVTKIAAQVSPAVNVTLQSRLVVDTKAANICGYTAGGREYALVGNFNGTAVVDVTDPAMPVNIQQIPALQSQWREIKVYRNYAYVTTEAGGQGLQIIDLTNLPNATLTHKNYFGGDGDLVNISKIHSLHIDTAKGFVYCYGGISTVKQAVGPNINVQGAIVLDIKTDPWNPKYAGRYSNNYIHDGFAINDTLYSSNIYAGTFSIIDFKDKTTPILLNTQTTPTNFNHNVWRSDDGKYLFTTDENAGSYLTSYDVSDALNIKFLDKMRSPSGAAPIVHNTHYLNGFAVTSWYTEGVIITDAHRPQNLIQVGQYDMYSPVSSGFQGCWGVYPYFPSGNLVASTLEGELFVLTPQYVRACYLEGVVTDAVTGFSLSGALVKINSTDADKKAESNVGGKYYTGQVTPGTVSVTYSRAGYISQTINTVVLANGTVTLQDVQLMPIPAPVELVEFKGFSRQNGIELNWKTASEFKTEQFEIERSLDAQYFEKIGVVKANLKPSNYVFWDKNPFKETQYYRLKIVDFDGSFEYSKTINLGAKKGQKITLFPSITEGVVFIDKGDAVSNLISDVKIYNAAGILCFNKTGIFEANSIDLSTFPTGMYLVQINAGQDILSQKIFRR